MNPNDKEKFKSLERELRAIEELLALECSKNQLEYLDLMYLAQRVEDIKQERRIIRARNI